MDRRQRTIRLTLSGEMGIPWGTEVSNQDSEQQGDFPGSVGLSIVFTRHEKLSRVEGMS